jgi:hypothetical protein
MKRICKYCNQPMKKSEVSLHSLIGHHLPPFVEMHEKCHHSFHYKNPNFFYSQLNRKWLKEHELNSERTN